MVRMRLSVCEIYQAPVCQASEVVGLTFSSTEPTSSRRAPQPPAASVLSVGEELGAVAPGHAPSRLAEIDLRGWASEEESISRGVVQ